MAVAMAELLKFSQPGGKPIVYVGQELRTWAKEPERHQKKCRFMHLIYRNAICTWEAHMNLYRHIFIKKKKKKEKKKENSASNLSWGQNKNKI